MRSDEDSHVRCCRLGRILRIGPVICPTTPQAGTDLPPAGLRRLLVASSFGSGKCARRPRHCGYRRGNVGVGGRDCPGPAAAPKMDSEVLHREPVVDGSNLRGALRGGGGLLHGIAGWHLSLETLGRDLRGAPTAPRRGGRSGGPRWCLRRVALFAALLTSGTAVQTSVNLGTAGNFVILAKSGISTIPTSAVTGDIGVSPIDSTAITGFALNLTAGSAFATSAQITGKVYAPGFAAPTPVNLTTAIGDMQTAYTDAAGRTTPDFTELGAGQIGGLTLVPGLYKWGTDVLISSDVTLSGGPNDVWISQIAGKITQANGTMIHLSGGALAANIF
jgi:hypothetical protein